MDNAMEQKKEYTAPEMNVVELQHRGKLLEGSCQDADCWRGEGA